MTAELQSIDQEVVGQQDPVLLPDQHHHPSSTHLHPRLQSLHQHHSLQLTPVQVQLADFNFPTSVPPPINPIGSRSIKNVLLCILIPSLVISLSIWPFAFISTLVPILVIIGLPIWLTTSILSLLCLAWIPYLLFAQDDRPSHTYLLLPSPTKAPRIVLTLIKHLSILLSVNWIELILDYSYRKIIVIGRHKSAQQPLLRRDIIYAYSDGHHRRRHQRLDIYLPPSFSPDQHLAPVFVFIHPGGWRWFDKSHFLQLGLRLRRSGFCVVIPDFTQFPDGRCPSSVRDITTALRWVHRSISEYGGDPQRIFLAGHGSGAHLALLTVLESSISTSLAEHGYPSPYHSFSTESMEQADLPAIEGMILLSGIYDPIKQLRDEAQVGWHEILALRRSLGPTHSLTLSHSPAHLLHWGRSFLLPKHLPSKFLIIHGGQDRNVPILQSHLLSTLLESINRQTHDDQSSSFSRDSLGKSEIKVQFKAFKNLDHLSSLLSLMIAESHPQNNKDSYGKLIMSEILSFVD